MITEDYVSFESAKLLKEKGYWNIATMLYKENGDIVNYNVPLNNKGFSSTLDVFYEAPTLQMAMKWLREKYSLEIYPYHNYDNSKWWYEIIKYPNSVAEYECGKDEELDTYEQACEAAIRYTLENLI